AVQGRARLPRPALSAPGSNATTLAVATRRETSPRAPSRTEGERPALRLAALFARPCDRAFLADPRHHAGGHRGVRDPEAGARDAHRGARAGNGAPDRAAATQREALSVVLLCRSGRAP